MKHEAFGLLNLHKPIGITSRDAVNHVSRRLRKIKVGHAGTLDPIASGVLVLCVGGATRLIEYVQRMPKTYRAVVRFGATSDTLDADGKVEETPSPPIPTEPRILDYLATQIGTILQMPPQFSALKVDGRRAYDLAREGREVELEARPIEIHRIELLRYEWPLLEIEVECGSGTYIRSIARDIGEALGCGGLITVLTRTRIGPFRLEDAAELPDLDDPASILARLRPAQDALVGLPSLTLTEEELNAVRLGKAFPRSLEFEGEAALVTESGILAAVAEVDPVRGLVSPRRVLIPVAS